MNPEKSSSAPVTFTWSLFVAVDDPQYVSEQPDLRDVTFDLCFGVSRCLLMSFTPPYPITKGKPLSLARFFTRLYFVAHSSLNETKYVFFFAFVGPTFSAVIMLKKIKGVKIHGND